MNYKLCEYEATAIGGPVFLRATHQLSNENIVDIKTCLNIVNKIIQARDTKKIKKIIDTIPPIECLSNTLQKISKVEIPAFDY
jgi:hypothetical protein